MLDWIGRICGRRGKAWLFAALAILLSVGAPAKQLLAEDTAVQETEEQKHHLALKQNNEPTLARFLR